MAVDGGAIAVESSGGRSAPGADDFVRQYAALFGVNDPSEQLRRVEVSRDAIAHTQTTYEQVYRGVPVFSGILKVHQDARGAFVAANGRAYTIKPGFKTTPSSDGSAAVNAARGEIGADEASVERARLVIVDPGWYGDPPLGVHLAYHVVLWDASIPLREAFFVDAHTGAILDRWSMIYDARWRSIHDARGGSNCCFVHEATGCDVLECEAEVCERDPYCCLVEWDRTCARRASYYCDDLCLPGPLARAEGDPPTGVSDVDAAYDYFGDVHDYYKRAFGRDGIDGAGLPMVVSVNSLAPGCPNAFWTSSGPFSVFCQGTVIDDVVAHELTHGLTEYTAGLIYQNQSGQLNESFSDVFGELVDLFNGDAAFAGPAGDPLWPEHPTGPGTDAPNGVRTACSSADEGYPDGVRWMVGEDALVFGGAIRDMWDPTCEGDPDRANSPLQTCDIMDGGGVHSGSGIPNHAFALVTDGGVFNGHTILRIGPIKAGAVWYRALTTYLTIASDFPDSYATFHQSAVDLVGTFPRDPRTGGASSDMFTAADAAQVDEALTAVEMDTPGRCGWTIPVLRCDPRGPCADGVIVFADDFEHGVGGWTVLNSGPFTPYDWVLADGLPFDRPGTAWYCSNGKYGDCSVEDETGTHSLLSPSIALPTDAEFSYVAFTHYMECEPGYDGGNLSLRVNGGDWQTVPVAAFEFNPYNAVLRSATPYESTNPLMGQEAWSGVGGRWGTSVIGLRDLAQGGDNVEFRFDFGKDVCAGLDGWYVDDFVVYTCPDCDRNGVPDHHQFAYTAFTGLITDLGIPAEPGGRGLGAVEPFDSGRSLRLVAPPRTASDVTLSFTAVGDYSNESEYLSVTLNQTPIGHVFDFIGADCSATALRDTLTIPAPVFNAAADAGVVWLTMTTSPSVNTTLCPDGTQVSMLVEYKAEVNDSDGNGVLDVCEGCDRADAPARAPDDVAKNRYLSFVPGNPGRLTALRITPVDLPQRFEHLEGRPMWAASPSRVGETAGRDGIGPPVFYAGRLGCEPVFTDWGAVGPVHLYDDEIVPGSVYEVQAVDLACGTSDESNYSVPLMLTTSRWGDVAGRCDVRPCSPPDGRVDVTTDVTAVMDKFMNRPEAPSKTRTDLGGAVPDAVVDITDVMYALDAFLGRAYPFDAPLECP